MSTASIGIYHRFCRFCMCYFLYVCLCTSYKNTLIIIQLSPADPDFIRYSQLYVNTTFNRKNCFYGHHDHNYIASYSSHVSIFHFRQLAIRWAPAWRVHSYQLAIVVLDTILSYSESLSLHWKGISFRCFNSISIINMEILVKVCKYVAQLWIPEVRKTFDYKHVHFQLLIASYAVIYMQGIWATDIILFAFNPIQI